MPKLGNKVDHRALTTPGGSLQVAGGDWRFASTMWLDFCVFPLLPESPAKWGRRGPATV